MLDQFGFRARCLAYPQVGMTGDSEKKILLLDRAGKDVNALYLLQSCT